MAHYIQKRKKKGKKTKSVNFSLEATGVNKTGEQHFKSTKWKTISLEFYTNEMFSKNDSEKEAISDIQMLENSSSADLHIKKY